MSKVFNILAPAVLSALAFTGCSDDDSRIATGSGALTVSIEPQVLAYQETGDDIALPGIDSPAAADFGLTIVDAQGRYSGRWESFGDFKQNDRYFTGSYTAEAFYGIEQREGFNAPTFYCKSTFTVSDNTIADVTLRPEPVNAVFVVDFSESAKDLALMFNTCDGLDYIFSHDTAKLLFLDPENVEVSVIIRSDEGNRVAVPFTTLTDIRQGYFYHLYLDADGDASEPGRKLRLGFLNAASRPADDLTVTAAMLAATPAEVTLTGVMPSQTIDLIEGDTPQSPIGCTVTGIDNNSRLMLTTQSASLEGKGFPATLDLLHESAELDAARALGLQVSAVSDGKVTVDFTSLLGELIYTSDSEDTSTFSVKSRSGSSTGSVPVSFSVKSLPAEIEVVETSGAIVGFEHATLTVRSDTPRLGPNIAIYISTDNGATWEDTTVKSVTRRDDGLYDVTFHIPAGSKPVMAKILYCDELRTTVTIPRRSPDYELEADAFATHALIKVKADDPATVKAVAEYITLSVDGRAASVLERDVEAGIITVIDLTPGCKTTVTGTVTPVTPDYDAARSVVFRTEDADPVPNGDFEDIKEAIKYKNLPSGGRYAQYTVEIFNRQHTASYRLSVPVKGWSTVNAKTFCRDARNYNTWYMQPSTFTVEVDEAYSGGYAVELVSTAWDTDGPAIPDYQPSAPPFPDYSMNIPAIANRASGRLWLGGYEFDASTLTETYYEGIEWSSRPAALNGFYRYEPSAADRADHGTVEIEILGTDADGSEVTIAYARGELHIATGYTSFSLPLNYSLFGVKASKLKIMFSSSASPGDIDHERRSVRTFSDPVTSTSLGSRLWLDKLEFAY